MSFTPEEYERIRAGAQASAAAVVPVVYDLVKPETVVDVGGGEGWWARKFMARGCECLVLDETERETVAALGGSVSFWAVDLQADPLPGLDQVFDLAVCLEVAEHLPESAADGLVDLLCRAAPVVLFSAAIPGQGGLGHVNEQWPAYWAKLFETHGYSAWDCLRWKFWDDDRVEPWYRQNMMLLMANDNWPNHAREEIPSDDGLPLPLVHPEIFRWRIEERDSAVAIADGFTWTGP